MSARLTSPDRALFCIRQNKINTDMEELHKSLEEQLKSPKTTKEKAKAKGKGKGKNTKKNEKTGEV